ncbi:DUF1150 family protein [Pseudogemmobacter humi]|uniref:DUF1150 domain-containing protein n=1 Tax=Pseudogemmobacter humi TaxID=2483812 RepID=A0A3P5XXF2_9RHOB|nr:DUF1150 family protein [Pseudogemmobacter humi]VDC32853.1 hypothetical protein XINFAN_03461 [Pseudogemmobacter humi]
MNTPFPGFPEGKSRIVYVRPVPVTELPDEVRAQMSEQLGEDAVIYSVNATDGQRLALVADRNLAFHLAKAHDFAPVSVH